MNKIRKTRVVLKNIGALSEKMTVHVDRAVSNGGLLPDRVDARLRKSLYIDFVKRNFRLRDHSSTKQLGRGHGTSEITNIVHLIKLGNLPRNDLTKAPYHQGFSHSTFSLLHVHDYTHTHTHTHMTLHYIETFMYGDLQ